MSLIHTFGPKPVPNPTCPHCKKVLAAPRWMDREIPPKSGLIFRILYCGEEGCNAFLGFTLLGAKEIIEVPGGIPAGFDPTKVRG